MNCTGKLRNMASVYIRKNNHLLLLYREGHSIVRNLWIGSAGGHFEANELNDARACVLRETYEELGLPADALNDLSLRYITLRHADNEVRQNYYFFANLKEGISEDIISNEGTAKWFSLDDLDALPMPFTARYIINHYVATGQFDNLLYAGVADSTGVSFSSL